jgi:hypothetical protein
VGVEKERQAVLKIGLFPNQWKEKVNKMPDNQVLAIYLRLKSQGKL